MYLAYLLFRVRKSAVSWYPGYETHYYFGRHFGPQNLCVLTQIWKDKRKFLPNILTEIVIRFPHKKHYNYYVSVSESLWVSLSLSVSEPLCMCLSLFESLIVSWTLWISLYVSLSLSQSLSEGLWNSLSESLWGSLRVSLRVSESLFQSPPESLWESLSLSLSLSLPPFVSFSDPEIYHRSV